MRRSRPRLAFARRHEVSGGGHAVHRKGQGSAAPALLGGAEESLPDGYLACDLPGLAVGDALAVACAVRGCGGDGAARAHPRRAGPVRGDVFHCEGPSGLRRLPCFGREEGCCDAYVRGAWRNGLGVRCGAEQVEAWPFLAEAGYPGGDPFFGRFNV